MVTEQPEIKAATTATIVIARMPAGVDLVIRLTVYQADSLSWFENKVMNALENSS